ncbi:hypothetical protein E2N92_10835 [Methanofollis formosanus]|uniref:Uncharacterized protein n=1 Tax=Methanofollis formosanus TaxID=299308 RepID=A0A8G1A366_9EURY|nr:hypothetical protein [Methanofollis formosanus]QYZ79883.1 hypothetical protein E2N92_10835 [Methanofollis formosanus]
MGGEVYQAQVLKNFFETITGPDRNLSRIFMCVLSLAKLRMEPPETVAHLTDQLRKSRQHRELSIDILDYMCSCASELDLVPVQTAFGVKDVREIAETFEGISIDSF